MNADFFVIHFHIIDHRPQPSAAERNRAIERAQRQQLVRNLAQQAAREAAQDAARKARQDFFDAAKDQQLWKHREWERGDVPEEFNQASGLERDADEARDAEALRKYEAEDAALDEFYEEWKRGGLGDHDALDAPDDGMKPEGRKRGRRRGR